LISLPGLPTKYRQECRKRLEASDAMFDEKIVSVPGFLTETAFRRLLDAFQRQVKSQRVHIPIHKRGAALSYHDLQHTAPEIVSFYRSPQLHDWCSRLIGARVVPTPLNDLSSCSILIYDKPRDHIGWHYDVNFYRGRHFTALLSLVNSNSEGTGVSSAKLMIRRRSGDIEIPTPPNTFVLFEGACVYHRVTALEKEERRVILSMTFCTEPEAGSFQSVERRFKDIAYFGLKALWGNSGSDV
jgi:hypothetical protein